MSWITRSYELNCFLHMWPTLLMTPHNFDASFNQILIPEKIALASLATDTTADVYVGKSLFYCGWGSISNKPTPPKGMQCTELFGVAAAGFSANTNVICTKWPNKDNNVCPGDYGGPLYLVSGTTNTVVGIAAYSPDMKSNAPCKDGHSVEHSQVAGFSAWITATIAT